MKISDLPEKRSAFSYSLTVRMSDTDPYGIVNNSEYFSFFELARLEYIKKLGLDIKDFLNSFSAVSVSCKFVNSLKLMDTASVTTVINMIRNQDDSLEFRQVISNQNNLLIAKSETIYALRHQNGE